MGNLGSFPGERAALGTYNYCRYFTSECYYWVGLSTATFYCHNNTVLTLVCGDINIQTTMWNTGTGDEKRVKNCCVNIFKKSVPRACGPFPVWFPFEWSKYQYNTASPHNCFHSFKVADIWNKLPGDADSVPSLQAFKNRLSLSYTSLVGTLVSHLDHPPMLLQGFWIPTGPVVHDY